MEEILGFVLEQGRGLESRKEFKEDEDKLFTPLSPRDIPQDDSHVAYVRKLHLLIPAYLSCHTFWIYLNKGNMSQKHFFFTDLHDKD